VAASTVNGAYLLDLLPPGPYAVRFELEGFRAVETTVKISGDQTSRVDALMPKVTKVAEEVTVTGTYETISTTATNAATYESKLIQALPVSRDVSSYVDLTPGTVPLGTTPFGSSSPYYQIAGGVSSENLFLINGVAAGENIYGGFLPLFIEDAIQEATTTLASVSAEYGRFTGGVVSTLTKSGGNDFHGSLRLNLTNPKWTAPTPVTANRTDTLDRLWEGTLGGYILRDKLWFFLGGRTATATTSVQTYPPVSIPLDQTIDENRYEGKLTFSLTPNHRLIGSYLSRERAWANYYFSPIPVYDLDSFYPRQIPEDLEALNYSGVLSNAFFLEAQYSARNLAFANSGSRYTDVERGTVVFDEANYATYNSPIFCAVCPGAKETRGTTDAFAKGSVFLSTGKAGSHDLRFGADLFDDLRKANNWQSGTGYFLYADEVIIVGSGTSAKYYPVIVPGSSYMGYFPIFELSKGTHFKTQSAFVNDVWRLNNKFTFNLGVRYDKNDGTDASGTRVVKDSKWSPRLSVTWDPRGDGNTQVILGYGQYVAAIQNTVGDSQSIGGQPSVIYYFYDGPPVNVDGPQVETHEALRQVFAWLDSIGGPMANPQLWFGVFAPGYQMFIGDNLRSPSTTEWAAGVSQRLGTRGLLRLDYVNKTWRDIYAYRTDLTTGTNEDPFGNLYDRTIVENDNTFTKRKYWGLLLQGNYRFGDRLQVGGDYTYSKLYGTDFATTTDSGMLMYYYPEYNDPTWYVPKGYLYGDHRHKLNLYASWDAVHTRAFSWNLSLLQRYLSGRPYYGASGNVLVGPYVTNPGYAMPPVFTWYAFTPIDAYRTDAINSTDLAMTFTFKVAGLEIYVNPSVTNLFNNQAVTNPNTTVYVNFDQPDNLAPFNPFTDKPKECPQRTTCNLADGYNWQKGPDFGKAVQPTDYQAPRTFLLNVGVRF
ncbi:MAG: TonB-dependent receptor, partial [Acidobacteriia bacterium]|nr:TonB-dependent receptor [Terriglobia bacterium]